MSKSMENNTAAIYLRRSTEDDGKSVGQQERNSGLLRVDQTGAKTTAATTVSKSSPAKRTTELKHP